MKRIITLIIGLIAFAGCTQIPLEKFSAQELFRLGNESFYGEDFWDMDMFRYNDYSESIRVFEYMLDNYPYSRYSPIARLRIADAYFYKGGEENAVMAITNYKRFIKEHSGRPEVPYAYFQIGESYYSQKLDIDRETSSTQNAYSYYNVIAKDYPDSGYEEFAAPLRSECWEELAENGLYVAKYYFRYGDYQAAIERLDDVIRTYNTAAVIPEAFYYKARSLEEIGELQEAQTAWSTIVLQYPDSKFGGEAIQRVSE